MQTLQAYLGGLVRGYALPVMSDARGSLLPIELSSLPLVAARVFVVAAPRGAVRGQHAHRSGTQLLVLASGRIDVELRMRALTDKVRLEVPGTALLIPAGVWAKQTYLAEDSVLLVVADTPYDPSSYIEQT